MNKLLAFFFAITLFGSPNLTAACYRCDDAPKYTDHCLLESWPSPINVDVSAGFRRDTFRWSIAGFENTPNILSELQWKDLRIAQAEGMINYTSCSNYVVRVAGDFGAICHGQNIDADYAFNDKQGLFSLSRNKAGKGFVYDIDAAVGYRVTSTFDRFWATPLIGYSYHGQHLHMYKGRQAIALDDDSIEIIIPFANLHSTYNTRWFGPWIGLDFMARVESCAYVFGGFEWHLLSYRGFGHWNLRNDIGDFVHKAHGTGYTATLGGTWEIWTNVGIGVSGEFRYFKTRHGREVTPIFIPDFPEIKARTRFNQAKWKAVIISADMTWRF